MIELREMLTLVEMVSIAPPDAHALVPLVMARALLLENVLFTTFNLPPSAWIAPPPALTVFCPC
jgi:hypothetical protein